MAIDAIQVERLGKRYRIGARAAGSLYDRLAGRPGAGAAPTVWAVRDVTLAVPHGSVLGLLGRNGSGKTSILKMLARVTAPTEGEARIAGRVAALLQVGTGFHPELTGRDNVVLSGMILGMTRPEINAIGGAIFEFADIDDFLDTPVKRYSSGMYMRLAFSVAAHMPADVMLIDEVLSVGDAGFQAKCHERIRALVATGRTVLFVSHSMASVRTLCDAAVVLDHGRLVFDGDVDAAARFYEGEILGQAATIKQGQEVV